MGVNCCSAAADSYSEAPGAKRGRDFKDCLQEQRILKDPGCERKLKNLDYEMNFQDINFENFLNSLKKYGYSG
jgi:hypothetical protein